ncbi:MAG: rhodanese-like domain-containing protein [Magnetococcales bacterium]|nr:rhodanese-like domain-containing protein [Magnetococcales bacterium]
MKKSFITPRKFLKETAKGTLFRVIDFRGDYWRTIPGAIPVQFDYDIFFEEEGWTQDKLGVAFSTEMDIVLVCETGGKSREAIKLFKDQNPKSRFSLYSLDGGWMDYLELAKQLTKKMVKQEQLLDELTDIRTSRERFQHITNGLLRKEASWFRRLFS